MEKCIMEFKVQMNSAEMSVLETKKGVAAIVPFSATVESELFTGKTLPGAVDVQTIDETGARHMCAKYMFEGVDRAGTECRLFVENTGDFPTSDLPNPFHTAPVFLTDSDELDAYFTGKKFRTEGNASEEGLVIKVIEV